MRIDCRNCGGSGFSIDEGGNCPACSGHGFNEIENNKPLDPQAKDMALFFAEIKRQAFEDGKAALAKEINDYLNLPRQDLVNIAGVLRHIGPHLKEEDKYNWQKTVI